MNATAKREAKTAVIYQKETLIRFEEGLIGFSDCKTFVLMEGEGIAPFRLLQSVDRSDLAFLVLDPTVVMKDYHGMIPSREWETLGLDDPTAKLAFAICIVGPTPADSIGNFQAPIIINYKKMVGRQIILADSDLSVRQPLLQ
jgi:flagellar assembly factor FliW